MAGTAQVVSVADWRADRIAGSGDWRLALADADRAEVLAALPDGAFPLPALGTRLRALGHDVAHGRGFGLVRGLPVEGLTEAQCETLALGIASQVGVVVAQEPGVYLMHVRDRGVDPALPTSRSYQHSQSLGFHADPTDIVALLCIRPARSGGLSTIVSSVAVHNEIVRTRPDLAELLYRPWWFDRRTGDGPDSFYQQPVYAIDDAGRLTTRYGPDYMRSAQRGPHVPPLTAGQREAMQVLDRLNKDPRFALTMDLRAGDMQFLNNHVILHARTAYEDHPEPHRRRDLIRLWLSVEE